VADKTPHDATDAEVDTDDWPEEDEDWTEPVHYADAPTADLAELGPDAGADIHPDDVDDEWHSGPPKRGVRLAVPTMILGALVVLGLGFWGGAVAEKHHNPPAASALSSLASRFASRAGATGAAGAGGFGGTGASGFGGSGSGFGGGAASAATEGIVTGVEGNTLYVTNAQGTLVKVTAGPSATITQSSTTPLAGLTTGNTVIVRGTTNSDGSVTATAITSTPASSTGAGAG
jgi:hypothetical protein